MRLFFKQQIDLFATFFIVIMAFFQRDGLVSIPLFKEILIVFMSGFLIYTIIKMLKSKHQTKYEIMVNVSKLVMFSVILLVFMNVNKEIFTKDFLVIIMIVINLLFIVLLYKNERRLALAIFLIDIILRAIRDFYYK